MTDTVYVKAFDLIAIVGAIQMSRIVQELPGLTHSDYPALTGHEGQKLAELASNDGLVSLKPEHVAAIRTAYAGVYEILYAGSADPAVINRARDLDDLVKRGFTTHKPRAAKPAPEASTGVVVYPVFPRRRPLMS